MLMPLFVGVCRESEGVHPVLVEALRCGVVFSHPLTVCLCI